MAALNQAALARLVDSDYDADSALQVINKLLESENTTPAMVREHVLDLECFLRSHHESLQKVKRARTGTGKVRAETEALQEEIDLLKAEIEQTREKTRIEVEDLKAQSDSLREPIAMQCERVRLFRSEPNPPKPLKLIKAIHEITRAREAEIQVATKQLRELKTILDMMKTHEKALEVESTQQIKDKTREKDRDIHELAIVSMRERDQMLQDLQMLEADISEIQDHLQRGHYESQAKKKEKLGDYRAKMHREYIEAEGVHAVFDERPLSPDDGPLSPGQDKSVIALVKPDPKTPSGLHFQDRTRLASVDPGSLAEKAGFARFIGRRVVMINDKEVRPGQALRLGRTSMVFKFDLDMEKLRCSYIKTEDDDPIVKFDKKQSAHRDPYKEMEKTTDRMRAKTKEEREQLEIQKRRLRDYEDDMKRERYEKEREIKKLQERLNTARDKQQDYEGENKKLQGWMEINSRTLKHLRGKNRESERMIENHQKEIRAITLGPEDDKPETKAPEEEEETPDAPAEAPTNGEAADAEEDEEDQEDVA
eukprot:TRINITY_DN2329_c0_g1_i1.p1 TRINITY_DN2329_c0_g1~~TRINITY_DN2329_c0_g1_i1.p1  ORF type:complete len:538 (+),score=286.46 TRINITY_DN2329_c0_g1_i1:86-1699(+)